MTRCCDIDPIVFGHYCELGRPQRPRFEFTCDRDGCGCGLPLSEPTEPGSGDQLAQLNHEIRSYHMAQSATAAQDRFNRMFGRLIR